MVYVAENKGRYPDGIQIQECLDHRCDGPESSLDRLVKSLDHYDDYDVQSRPRIRAVVESLEVEDREGTVTILYAKKTIDNRSIAVIGYFHQRGGRAIVRGVLDSMSSCEHP